MLSDVSAFTSDHQAAKGREMGPNSTMSPRPLLAEGITSRLCRPAGLVDRRHSDLQLASCGNRFVRDGPALSPREDRSSCSSSPLPPPTACITAGQLAFSAMQFLPVPLLVLSSVKTVVLANEAMGRLLGMAPELAEEREEVPSVMDRLRGQTLSQVGVDMLQDGRPIWINWEHFLDSMIPEIGAGKTKGCRANSVSQCHGGGDVTPTVNSATTPPTNITNHLGQNAVIEVIISRKDINKASYDPRVQSKTPAFQVCAKMICTVLEVDEHQVYFTLTFTNTESTANLYPFSKKSVARANLLETAERALTTNSNTLSVGSCHDSNTSSHTDSPNPVSLSSSPFLPPGPPPETSLNSTPSVLQKIVVMKDALLDTTDVPIIAMWKDGSVILPNKAARRFFKKATDFDNHIDGLDLLPAWDVWKEDFTTQLEPSEFPTSVLIRTETPFSGRRIGVYDVDGNKLVYDILGEVIRDEITGEFLAGVVTCRDVTRMTQLLTRMREQDAERFKIMCDSMPQFVWTTTGDGYHDFYNIRWYDYTGFTEAQSLGEGWMNAIHPDDLPESTKRWRHSLHTGDPYLTEYRCRSKDGEWRWFIGRALSLRDKETGKIEKWFGTCTDANESIKAKLEAERTRQQLLSVIAHAHVTIFTVDLDRRITMLEGALIEGARGGTSTDEHGPPWYIGEDVYKVFGRLSNKEPRDERAEFLQPIEAIIISQTTEDLREHEIDGRFYRTRFLPVFGNKNHRGEVKDSELEGVVGMIMDVTELKSREADIEAQAKEKQQLMANEAAAREASRLKSQFLANMSHEIRTPITGVIGMAELLLDLELDKEQREYTENIYRSGNALLTVINDILDFSKVESGRLDIEEVHFSLSVIVRDVNKMLSFAAERKSLDFQTETSPDIDNDLVVVGDPGRVRQIITNLLTNSIKFTNQGFVKFSVEKEKETPEMTEIKFVIEDTGIGIEEDVRRRLFQPFSQGDASTARKFGGTGLGLTICKNLLDLMRGRMTLESTLGSGTTAIFWIPFNKPQNSHQDSLVHIDPLSDRLQSDMSLSCNSSEYEQLLSTPPGELGIVSLEAAKLLRHKESHSTVTSVGMPLEEELATLERSKVHVLVVEDNAINQQIATKTIEKLGFGVTAVWNGREALDYLVAAEGGKEPRPDIILMDVQMPVIDGYKCTHLIRHHLPYKSYIQDVPIVAMTASAIQGDREKCRRAGMDDYLPKPVKSKALERMLIRWSLTRRENQSSLSQGSQMSDCSEASEHCENASIPGLSHEGIVDVTRSLGLEALRGLDDIVRNLPTPRPLTRSTTEESQFLVPRVRPPLEPVQSRRRIETDERAMKSRDGKLVEAATPASETTQQSHQLPHSLQKRAPGGEALTKANMERLEREEAFKRFA